MNFGILSETQLKETTGGKLDKLIDIWNRDVTAKTGKKIDIVLGNRRDNESPVRGGILTEAALEIKEGRTRLKIWYDPLELYYEARVSEMGYHGNVIEEMTEMLREDRDPGPEYDPVSNPQKLDADLLARQIGRWLLKFRGFKRLRNENSNFFELEAFINLESGIPALYSLLDEACFDFSSGEKKRLREVYEGLSNMDEPSKRIDRTLNALRVSNLLQFSTESKEKTALKSLISGKFGRISAISDEIDELKSECGPDNAAGLDKFLKKLVLKYRMPGVWVSIDEQSIADST